MTTTGVELNVGAAVGDFGTARDISTYGLTRRLSIVGTVDDAVAIYGAITTPSGTNRYLIKKLYGGDQFNDDGSSRGSVVVTDPSVFVQTKLLARGTDLPKVFVAADDATSLLGFRTINGDPIQVVNATPTALFAATLDQGDGGYYFHGYIVGTNTDAAAVYSAEVYCMWNVAAGVAANVSITTINEYTTGFNPGAASQSTPTGLIVTILQAGIAATNLSFQCSGTLQFTPEAP